MPESIESLFVEIGADVSKLLDDARKGVKETEKELGKFEKRGKKSFDTTTKASAGLGVQIGVVTGLVSTLTQTVINMGARFVASLGRMIGKGVDLNKNLETAERTFSAAFGSPELGKATIDFLDKTAKRLNISKALAVEFAQGILPKTGSLSEFTELLRLTDIQADATGKTVGELRFAIREALSGDFVSLKDQFDLSRESIDRIKELTPELGRSGALAKVIGEEFERLGKVNIQGTLATDIKSLQERFGDLQQALGLPVFEELKNVTSEIGQVLQDREGDFTRVAGAIGDVIANVVDFVGTNFAEFLKNLDTEQLIDTANNFYGIVESARNLVKTLDLVALPGDLLGNVESLSADLKSALTTAVQLAALAKAQLAKQNAELERTKELAEEIDLIGGGLITISGKFQLTDAEKLDVAAAGQEAYNKVILDTAAALDESNARVAENEQRQTDRANAIDDSNSAQQDQIDGILAGNAALDEQNAKLAAQKEILEGLSGEFIDASEQLGADRAALEAEHTEKIQEIEAEHGEKMADLAQEHGQKIAELEAEAAKERVEANKEYQDGIEDLEKETAKKKSEIIEQAKSELSKLETETDQKLIDERDSFQKDELRETEDHLKDMRRLRLNFLDNLGDAVKNRDARAIVDLRRKFNREKQEQESDFQEKQQREREDQDARLAQIREDEARRAAEIMAARDQDLVDLQEHEREKRAELEASLQEQLADIDANLAERRAKENADFEERRAKEQERYEEQLTAENEQFAKRQSELDEALKKRLEAVAKQLADEKDIDEEGAKAILESLNNVFGAGGDIDALMEDFRNRRRQKLTVIVEFDQQIGAPPPPAGAGQGGGGPQGGGGGFETPQIAGSFAEGGRIIADKPTVALFGEAGPEMATFTPLGQMSTSAMDTQRVEVEAMVDFRGVPPGMDERALREATASVIVSAFRDAGIVNRQ